MLSVAVLIGSLFFGSDSRMKLNCADSMLVRVYADSLVFDSIRLRVSLDATPSCRSVIAEYGQFEYLSFTKSLQDSIDLKNRVFGDLGSETFINSRVSSYVKFIPMVAKRIAVTYYAKLKISEIDNDILIEKTKVHAGSLDYDVPREFRR